MQQAATRAQQVPSSAADGDAAPGVLRNAFVINLSSSTTPVALKRPEHAGLKRFNFFVSRRREEGRERFRLHMGYFDTQEQAEKLLDIVREIYPGAWAGLAPGRGLRGTPPLAQPEPDPERELAAERSVAAVSPSASRPRVASGGEQVAQASRAQAPRIVSPRAPAAPATIAVATPNPPPSLPAERRARPSSDRHAAAQSLGNVRAAIDALEDSAERARPAAVPPTKPRVVPTLRAAHPIPTLNPVAPSAPLARAPMPPAASVASAPSARAELDEPAVLKLLEGSARAPGKSVAPAPASDKPVYAVQLAWSVEPIDLTQVPQLAIFNAYSLYGAQGHRDGRRWYGLRLGFFTDAVSAKQVAQYVRSDFATVSVVPVSTRERDQAQRATAAVAAPTAAAPAAGAARPPRPSRAATVSLEEFKFIDDAADALPEPANKGLEPRADGKRAPPARPGRGAPGKRAVFRAGRIHATRKAKQMTLEETLEILGANDLEVDARKRRVAHGQEAPLPAAAPSGKPSKLSRLFERLSERLGT